MPRGSGCETAMFTSAPGKLINKNATLIVATSTERDKNNSQIMLNCWPLDELDKIYEVPGLLLVDIHANTLRCGGAWPAMDLHQL